MRILFSAGPMYGHVNTMLPLVAAARRAGHDVVLATGPDLVDHVASRGIATWSIGPSHAAAGGRAALSPEYFVATGTRRAADLVPLACDWRPDLVVHEEMELAGAVAAAVTGARHVVHGLGLMPPAWLWELFGPIVDELAVAAGAPHGPDPARSTYLRISPPSLQAEASAPWADVRLVRPAFGEPGPADRMPVDVDDFIRRGGDPLVHLTLGTVFHETPGILATAIEGLRDHGIRLVVTTGPGVHPSAFGRQPANVRILPYVPHALFLRRCDVIVSQGGAGIMFGALASGRPQLMLPQGADQFANAEACCRAGVALSLAPDEVTPSAVALAVRRLLASPSFWAASSRLRSELAAMPSPADALTALTGHHAVPA